MVWSCRFLTRITRRDQTTAAKKTRVLRKHLFHYVTAVTIMEILLLFDFEEFNERENRVYMIANL